MKGDGDPPPYVTVDQIKSSYGAVENGFEQLDSYEGPRVSSPWDGMVFIILSILLLVSTVLNAISFYFADKVLPGVFLNTFCIIFLVPMLALCCLLVTFSCAQCCIDNSAADDHSVSDQRLVEEGEVESSPFASYASAGKDMVYVELEEDAAYYYKCGVRHDVIVLIAALTCAGNALQIVGGVRTSGPLQSLLQQLVVPFNMLFAKWFLQSKFSVLQYGGGFCVCIGVFITLVPHFFYNSDAFNGNDVYAGDLIFFLSVIPTAMTNIAFEYYLKRYTRSNIVNVILFVVLYQVPLSILVLPVYALPSLPDDVRVPLHTLPAVVQASFDCVFHRVESLNGNSCQYADVAFYGLILTALLTTVFSLLLTRRYSATATVIVSGIALPATILLYNMPLLAQGSPPNWDWSLFVGLFIVIGGNYVYKMTGTGEGGVRGH